MKTVDVDMLRKRYLFHAELKASEEIDSLISELKKHDCSEENVFTKDEVMAMLKEIQEEITRFTSRYSLAKERGGMGQVEWSDRLIREVDILQILDKYKAKIEPQEMVEVEK